MKNNSSLVQLFYKILKRSGINEKKIIEQILINWEQNGEIIPYKEVQKEKVRLHKILELNKILNSKQDLDSILTIILDNAIQMVKAQRGFLIMEDGQIAIARNFDKEWINKPAFKISHSLAKKTLQTGNTVITDNALSDDSIKTSISIEELELKSIACIPLQAKEKILGVLYLDNRFCSGAFTKVHIQILKAFADQAALAIYNTRILKALEKSVYELKRLDKYSKNKKNISLKLEKEHEHLSGYYSFEGMVSCSENMKFLFQLAQKAGKSNIPVLITGESGTGKGVLAKAIHKQSQLNQGPFVAENCAAIPESLLESELFGYCQGAFTGAKQNKKGLFDLAHEGTLFLDEIGDMSLSMQGKLLRILETQKVRPLGDENWHTVNVRIICATHKNLEQLIQSNKFREDLWYRLSVIKIEIPPLRKRTADIPLLVQNFLQKYEEAKLKNIKAIDEQAIQILKQYHWPGNVRQLEQELKRMIALKKANEKILKKDISRELLVSNKIDIPTNLPLKKAVLQFEKNYVKQILDQVNWNKTKAAKILGITRRSLYNKIDQQEKK